MVDKQQRFENLVQEFSNVLSYQMQNVNDTNKILWFSAGAKSGRTYVKQRIDNYANDGGPGVV